jgi:UDP-2,3-diacylglucosamine hydrolase
LIQDLKINRDPIYFISDTHFHDKRLPSEVHRRQSFSSLLDSIPQGAALFLLGDIFDFYFEYNSVVHNCYFDIFCALRRLSRRGVQMHFLGGNHDSWTGSFLREEIGVDIHREEIRLEAQGRRIVCVHGDLILPGDRGYKILKAVIRNPSVIAAARLVHPDLLSAIARLVSKASKRITKRSQEAMAKRLGDIAFARYFSNGNDAFIMGHVHYPLHQTSGRSEFVILGDWIDHFSYAVLSGGKLRLEKFTSEKQG